MAAICPLKEAAAAINLRTTRSVTIEGHTDSMGSAEYNRGLSLRRAQSVRNWLVKNRVDGAPSFELKAWGESRPVAPNRTPDDSDNPDGRRRNRRVEVRFSA